MNNADVLSIGSIDSNIKQILSNPLEVYSPHEVMPFANNN